MKPLIGLCKTRILMNESAKTVRRPVVPVVVAAAVVLGGGRTMNRSQQMPKVEGRRRRRRQTIRTTNSVDENRTGRTCAVECATRTSAALEALEEGGGEGEDKAPAGGRRRHWWAPGRNVRAHLRAARRRAVRSLADGGRQCAISAIVVRKRNVALNGLSPDQTAHCRPRIRQQQHESLLFSADKETGDRAPTP